MLHILLNRHILWLALTLVLLSLTTCAGPSPGPEPIKLRLEVFLTPQELATFESALEALDETNPQWDVILEITPQSALVEKINTQLAGGTLPDVVRIQGLFVQQWIRRGAFLDMTPLIEASQIDLADFYEGPLEQFRWHNRLWGLPDTAAPDVVFYNKDLFDASGLSYPTDGWSYEEMRQAAILLTLDANGRNPTDPQFDPETIQQWGWNGGITYLWQRHLARAFGGDFCANEDCTLLDFTSPSTLEAVRWWVRLVSEDHAAPYDPYSGSQTGVPGDPFIAGKAAMGYNGFFAVGQLNDLGAINYDIVQAFLAEDGRRYTPLSTNGYVISANSEHPQEAWALVQALLSPEFLRTAWGEPGHSIPARRSASDSVINLARAPSNQRVIVEAMEYGEVFKPYTAGAFEAHAMTADLFVAVMAGELPLESTMAEIEDIANQVLARDREPPS